MRPPTVLLAIAIATIAAGALLLGSSIAHYLDGGRAPSSTSGIRVFKVGDELIAYPPYVIGWEPLVIGIGLALLVAALLVKAALRR
ncbi:MAG: hypothetical protein ABJB03_08825 [Rhodoglobus sp.]